MLLSRFWYGVLALALGAAVFILFVAAQLYNRSSHRAMSESLSADSSAVEWYLNDDARKRSSALIRVALNPALRGALAKSSNEAKPGAELREKARAALRSATDEVPPELKFDHVWAVDAAGRVIASVGFEHREDWELGGYPLVADALHGWIRDDAWVWKGRILRVVARPVEQDVNGEPVGAVIGAKIIDDGFARAVTKRTGAAVGFYAEGSRVASGAPEGFDKANLDQITQDLKQLEDNKDYVEKGRSEVRVIGEHLGVVYARLPGEAWELGAGYAVGRLADSVDSPFKFLDKASNEDKSGVPTALILLLAVLVPAAVGLGLSVLEHTRPLHVFRTEAARFAKGEVDVLAPSRFRGAYRKIAADINDGVEKVAVKGGAPRKAADLEQVLGPIPAQPAMSAFSVPLGPPGEPRPDSRPSYPKPVLSPRSPTRRPGSHPLSGPPPARDSVEPVEAIEEVSDAAIAISASGPTGAPGRPPPRRPPPPPPPKAPSGSSPSLEAPAAAAAAAAAPAPDPAAAPAAPQDGAPDADELTEWNAVYEEFLSVKQQCGEPTNALTFEKFKGTLQRNKDALVARHNCSRVRFTVYVKDGKAALKASPVK
ncbi:MXAN_5187 family protein [Sorangium sp. So ce131]|uniref:MXAN_5187 family protein n=1 Tax=Sorangium sp. So ce131 TaxID=3133282 RepID=UPI003F611721